MPNFSRRRKAFKKQEKQEAFSSLGRKVLRVRARVKVTTKVNTKIHGWSKLIKKETSVEIRKVQCVCRNVSCRASVGHVERQVTWQETVRKDVAKVTAKVL